MFHFHFPLYNVSLREKGEEHRKLAEEIEGTQSMAKNRGTEQEDGDCISFLAANVLTSEVMLVSQTHQKLQHLQNARFQEYFFILIDHKEQSNNTVPLLKQQHFDSHI